MSEMPVHGPALRVYAKRVEDTWVEWSDEDVMELAQEATDALRRLANRVDPPEHE